MRKGEKKKQDILRCAQQLFYEKGYENATVQDILERVGLSKGGFYHHYQSKEQLLADICEARAAACLARARDAIDGMGVTAIEKLNLFFEHGGMWHSDNYDFIGLLIQVAGRGDNYLLRERFREKWCEKMLPLLERVIKEGGDHYEFFPKHPKEICPMLLNLSHDLVDDIARYLLGCGEAGPNMGDVIGILEVYRSAIERVLDAPFGSITLYQIGALSQACQDIWRAYVAPMFASGKDPYRPLAVPQYDE